MMTTPFRSEDIDPEVLDIVDALNIGGLATSGSCSGHGKENGYVLLQDGRTLIIIDSPLGKGLEERIHREITFEIASHAGRDPQIVSNYNTPMLEEAQRRSIN